MPEPRISLCTPRGAAELQAAREVMREYARSLTVDLCFQDFDAELASLPGPYAEPDGALLLALVSAPRPAAAGRPPRGSRKVAEPHFLEGSEVAGCVAMRQLRDVDHANACEMKRLYVRPAYRRLGLGRRLAQAVIDLATQAGHSAMLLDTLDEMESARELYASLGFQEVPPYYFNPIPGAHYLKVDLGGGRY